MKIAFHLDPLATLKSYKDTTVAMMRAAQSRGHSLFAIEPGHVFSRNGSVQANGCVFVAFKRGERVKVKCDLHDREDNGVAICASAFC